MGLRDRLQKKDRLAEDVPPADGPTLQRLQAGPEFTFIRSDTHTQDIIHQTQTPTSPGHLSARDPAPSLARRSLDVFRPSRSRAASLASNSGGVGDTNDDGSPSRRLSQRLHLSRDKNSHSDYVPENLPQINVNGSQTDKDAYENQWENRATMLATANEQRRRSHTTASIPTNELAALNIGGSGIPPPGSPSSSGNGGAISSKAIDEDLQTAIRLHEEGDLVESTKAFGRLADPKGANNPLSQVLYGLALRHGWGCEPDTERAVSYLSLAASNSAAIEDMALKSGLKKGGAAKGELVLAIFELANCFRHGYGIREDRVAAKQYYETAANLGDTDAMNEVALCYLEGIGCKKNKFAAARYYRLAEENGNKTLGNSWKNLTLKREEAQLHELDSR